MKKLVLFSLAALCGLAFSNDASAQHMAAVNAAMAQHNLHFQNMMMHQMMQMSMARRSNVLPNRKNPYLVVMQDSTTHTLKSKILFDKDNMSYLEYEDKSLPKNDPNRVKRIYPKDTRSIKNKGNLVLLSSEGIPADSCWLFKTVTGKINGYTFLPATEMEIQDAHFRFFQKGTGSLQKLEKDSLVVMMGDNERAVKLVKKDKAYKALVEYNKPN